MPRTFIFALLAVGALLGQAACSDDPGGNGTGDCTSLCTEAQAGSCTAITGSCSSFCAALDDVVGPADCTAQYEAYENCLLGGDDACSNNCTTQENALSVCVQPYCALHANDPSCVTLAGSF